MKTVRREGGPTPQCGSAVFSPEEEDAILENVLGPAPEETDDPDDTETDTLEMTTEAVMEITGGRLTLRYAESEYSGMEGTVTEISFAVDEPGLVTIRREGTVQNALVLEKGKFHTSLYELPFTRMELMCATHQLDNNVTAEGGILFADYVLRIGKISTARTLMTLRVSVLPGEEAVL